MEPGQFSMGLIRYSCGHISGPHEPIPTKFGLWMFFIMLHRYMVSKMLKLKKKFFVMSSLLYSVMATQNYDLCKFECQMFFSMHVIIEPLSNIISLLRRFLKGLYDMWILTRCSINFKCIYLLCQTTWISHSQARKA